MRSARIEANTGTRLTNTPARPGPISVTPWMKLICARNDGKTVTSAEDQPAGRRRPLEPAERGLGERQGQRGHERGARQPGEQAERGDQRAAAQAQGVAGIEHAGRDHQDVAEVERESGEARELAAGGDDRHAHHGHQHARRLQPADRRPIGGEGADQHEHRGRALDDAEVHRRGPMGGDVEHRVEDREADRAHDRDEEQARAHRRPVAPYLGVGEHDEQAERAEPAQADQRHGRNLADGEPPQDGVAGPAQCGEREQKIRPPARPSVRRPRCHASLVACAPNGGPSR